MTSVFARGNGVEDFGSTQKLTPTHCNGVSVIPDQAGYRRYTSLSQNQQESIGKTVRGGCDSPDTDSMVTAGDTGRLISANPTRLA